MLKILRVFSILLFLSIMFSISSPVLQAWAEEDTFSLPDRDSNGLANFIQDAYTLTVNSAHGIVTRVPDQLTYDSGMSVVLTMGVADPGWTFTGWSGGGCTGTDPCTVVINANTTVTANFTQNAYTLTVNSAHGTVTRVPDQLTYDSGMSVVLTMGVADPGWIFTGWSGGGCTGTAPCTVVMNANTTVTANFTQNAYTLTVNSAHGTVTKAPDQPTYAYGTNVVLTMGVVDPGWIFTGWSGGGCTGTAPCTVVMNTNTTVTANFAKNANTLTVNSAHGTVTKAPDQPTYAYGTSVLLTMGTVDAGWTFTGWSGGGCTGTAPCTVVMNADTTVTANFTRNTYTLTVTTIGNGSVSRDNPGPYHYGDVVQLTATPDIGWSFFTWSGDLTGITTPASITIDGNKSVTATFSEGITLTLPQNLISSNGSRESAVLFTFDDGFNSLYTHAYAYMEARNVRGTGYITTDWVSGGNLVSWAQLQEMYGDEWTIGNHTKAHINLSTLSLSDQMLALLGGRNALIAHGMSNVDYVAYPYGVYNADTLTAMSNLGMRNGRTLLNYNNVLPLVSPFEIAQHSVYQGTSLATVQGWVNTAMARQEILVLTFHDISAYPIDNGWYIDRFQSLVNYCIQQEIPILTMDDLYRLQSSAITIPVAYFTPSAYTLTVNSAHGSVSKVPNKLNYAYGTSVVLAMGTVDTGWIFTGWSGGGCSGTAPCTVTMNLDITVTANFTPRNYTLDVSKTGTGSGTVTSNPTGISCGLDCSEAYVYNTSVTLSASAGTGSTFSGWSGACTGTGTCQVTMNADKSVTANFTPSIYTLDVSKTGTGAGTVTSNPAGINCGTDCSEAYVYNTAVTLSASPGTGSTFTGWSGACTGIGICQVTMNADRSVTANFTRNTNMLDVSKTGTGAGTVTSNPAGISCGIDCSEAYVYNTPVTLSASPGTDSTFSGWSGACTGTGTCQVTMDADKSVMANFTLLIKIFFPLILQ
jgi:uncharacterized repeat protein (TIGR02543 family)